MSLSCILADGECTRGLFHRRNSLHPGVYSLQYVYTPACLFFCAVINIESSSRLSRGLPSYGKMQTDRMSVSEKEVILGKIPVAEKKEKQGSDRGLHHSGRFSCASLQRTSRFRFHLIQAEWYLPLTAPCRKTIPIRRMPAV